jgi:hypothetical protein
MATVCFENGVFWTLLLAIAGITAYHYWVYRNPQKGDVHYHNHPAPAQENERYRGDAGISPRTGDVITMSDYRKLADPLTIPGRRVARDQIPPSFVNQWLNIETNPHTDSPTPVGYLYRADTIDVHNRMIRLIARRDRYRSTKQEYYALTKDGIKIQVSCPKDEFDDGDIVNMSELGGDYKVKIYSRDDPAYNPYVI